jgi:hypothetical protein
MQASCTLGIPTLRPELVLKRRHGNHKVCLSCSTASFTPQPSFVLARNMGAKVDEAKQPSPPIVDAEEGIGESDAIHLNASGHIQELDRNFGFWSICAISIVADNAWATGGGSLVCPFFLCNVWIVKGECCCNLTLDLVRLLLSTTEEAPGSSTNCEPSHAKQRRTLTNLYIALWCPSSTS